MNKEQKQKIQEVMRLVGIALRGVYLEQAVDMEKLSTAELYAQEKQMGYKSKNAFNFDYDTVAGKVLAEYAKALGKGGSMCIERVVKPISATKVRVSTQRVFVSWLDDFCKEKSDAIIKEIGDMELGGVHPTDIARALKTEFEGTRHRAMVGARTEASKLRNDVRSARFEEQGVEYVEWRTAGDDRVRPEHEERDGLIYRHADSPFIGEYQCRCLLVPADYKVDKGAKVEKSGSIDMDADLLESA